MVLLILFISFKNKEVWLGFIACIILTALLATTISLTMDIMREECKEYTREHPVIIYDEYKYKLNDSPKKFTIKHAEKRRLNLIE